MKSANLKKIQVKIVGLGIYTGELIRTQAPISVQNFSNALPIKGRGFLQETRLILANSLKARPEGVITNFAKGDISLDPSSGNISIFLADTTLDHPENHLGQIKEMGDTTGLTSTAIIISSID